MSTRDITNLLRLCSATSKLLKQLSLICLLLLVMDSGALFWLGAKDVCVSRGCGGVPLAAVAEPTKKHTAVTQQPRSQPIVGCSENQPTNGPSVIDSG